MNEKKYLNAKDAAEYCGFSPGTFNNYRCRKIGCTYIKRGWKILYERQELDRWLRDARILTSE
jgi:hypothetical protein